MRVLPITVDQKQLAALCRGHCVDKLFLFGSILRDDFRPESDVDVLVEFQPGATLTLESYVDLRAALSTLFDGRDIDLVEAQRLADPYRRHEIMRTREQIWSPAAGRFGPN